MRNVPGYIYFTFVSFLLIGLITYYVVESMKEDQKVIFLNETISMTIPNSIDLGKSRVTGKLFLNKPDFETKVKNAINSKYSDAELNFDYLQNEEAIKAIKVKMEIDNTLYTTTYKLNEY